MSILNYNKRKIIEIYSAITGRASIREIEKILKQSKVYREIENGNDCYLQEGYTANILEIVNELQKDEKCLEEVFLITPESVVMYNLDACDEKKEYQEDDRFFIPEKYLNMTIEELEYEILLFEELDMLLRKVPDISEYFYAALTSFVGEKESAREIIVEFLMKNPNTNTSEILKYLAGFPYLFG